MNDFTPQTGAFQNVCLVDADDVLVPLPGGFESHACDTLYFHFAVALGVICFFAVLALASAPFAEVDAAGQFTNHHDVEALCHDVFPQGAVAFQSRIQLCRTEVGEQSQSLTDSQQSLFRTEMRRHLIPLVVTDCTADSTQQDTVACQTAVNGFFRQGNAGGIDRTAADEVRGAGEGVTVFLANLVENSHSTVYDLRTDTVAPKQCNVKIHGKDSFVFGLAEQIVDIPHLFRKYSFIIHQSCEDYKVFVKILHFATKKPVRRGLCR